MQQQKKNPKALIVGIIGAVVLLAALLALVLTQCVGGAAEPTTVTTVLEAESYQLYYNLDKAEYAGKSEAGLSSREPEPDGFYHIRFFIDGEEIVLKVEDGRLVNTIDTMDIMGLTIEDGIVTGVIPLEEMPLEMLGWEFFVQSVGGNNVKLNSSKTFNGMEVMLKTDENTRIYDMAGKSGPVGCTAVPVKLDRVYAIADLEGNVTHIFLYDRTYYMREFEAECQHCKEVVTWKEWTMETTLPTQTGHYKLMNDIVVANQQMIQEDQKICLDLNGKLVTNKETKDNYYRIYGTFNPASSLALMDTSEEQTGTIKATGTADKGLCVWVRYGEFHMYGGTLDASEAQSYYPGTTVSVEKNAFAYMYGGEIIGGLSKYLYNAETKSYSRGSAGALYITGKFVMHDGVIRDGRAEAIVTERYEDGTPKTTQRGPGGNIFINTGGVMEMRGGTVKNGVAGTTGGNIWVNTGAELTISGGVISGGKATGRGANGGNLFINSGATVTMTGGTISGGSAYSYAGNVYCNGNFTMRGGTITGGKCYDFATKELKENHTARNVLIADTVFTMSGGRIDGGLQIYDVDATKQESGLVLSGSAKIYDEKGGSNLTLSNTSKGGICQVKVGKLSAGAKIGVTSVQQPVFTQPTDAANTDKFVSSIEEADILWTEQGLAIGRMQCVCGGKAVGVGDHKCEQVLFTPWSDDSKLPNSEGNFFLTKDVTLKSHTEYKSAAVVNIDMNGYDITMNATENWHRVFRARNDDNTDFAVTIGLTNSKTTGGVVKTNSKVDVGYGMMVWLTQKSQTFNLYDGVLDASALTGVSGGVAVKLGGGTFNMYGGAIKGGYDNNKNTSSNVRGGGAVTVEKNGCFNLYAGTVSGGGTVSNGGNFMLKGKLNVFGGTISDGRADNVGGNIMSYAGSSLSVYGGRIYGGYKPDKDGSKNYTTRFANVYSYGGDVTLSGGTVSGLAFYKGDAKAPKLVLSGNVVIDSYKNGIGLALSNAVAEIDDTNGEFTGKIAMTTGGYITGKTKEAYAANFASLADDLTAVYLEEKVFLGRVMCVCGGRAVGVADHKCEDIVWTPWSEGNKLPNTEGNYYLTKDVTLTGSTEIKKPGTVNIDMNGYNITMNATQDYHRVFVLRDADNTNFTATVGLTNSNTQKGGVVTVNPKEGLKSGYGTIVWLNKPNHTFNLYAGVLDGTAVKAGSGGAVVKMADGSKFNMYGGEIKGGTAVDRDAGTVYINAKAQFNLYGGTVSGGRTTKPGTTDRSGGNFYVAGTLKIDGGTVTGGYAASNGGNINVVNGGELELKKGTVSDGACGNVGGNIQIWSGGKLKISGGTVSGGYKLEGANKNYVGRFVNAYSYGGDVTLSGGTVSGLAVYKDGTKGSLTLSGNPVVNTYNGGVGLAMNAAMTATIDETDGAFAGQIAMTTGGYITGKTDKKYTASFDPIADNMNTLYHDEKIYIGEESRVMCACGGRVAEGVGQHEHQELLWKAWTSDTTLPTEAGNWYLTKSVTLKASTEFKKAGTVNIDMNGFDITMNATENYHRVFVLRDANNTNFTATVGLTNSDTEKGGTVTVNLKEGLTSGYGSFVWLNQPGHTFNLYAGVLEGTSVRAGSGGAIVKMADGSKFNMYGGEIRGGTAVDRDGGTVYVNASAQFNLYGGTVSGGRTTQTGTDNRCGGNFYVAGTLNVAGGQILNGAAYAHGGNVYVPAGGKLNVTGGTISGGYRSNSAAPNYNTIFANVYVLGEAKVSGGTVSGLSIAGGKLTLSGNPTIDGSRGLMYSGTPTITIDDSKGDFAGTVSVWPTAAGYITGENDKDYSDKFSSLDGTYNVMYYNKRIYVTNAAAKAMCACGGKAVGVGDHQCKDLLWTAWDKSDSLPTTTGNYYLTSETGVTLSKSVEYKTAAEVNIDLNGKTVTLASTDGDSRIFKIQGGTSGYKVTVGLTDSVGGGSVIRTHTGAETIKYGSVVWLADTNHTFNLYAGVLDGSAVISSNGGAVIKVSNGKFNMYGGEVKGGYDNNTNTSSSVRGGGAVTIESAGTFNLYNGTVSGGRSVSTGGNFMVKGTLNVKGGTISGGTATTEGGNIYVASGGTLAVSGGTVTGGYANFGGNIYAIGSVNVSGGAVSNGYAATNGGNIYVAEGGKLEMTGGAVSNGAASNVGGNIQVWNNGTLIVSGGTISGGYKQNPDNSKNYTTTFANVYSYGGKVTLSGGTVSGIAVYKGDVNTSGLTLSGNPVVNSYNGGIGLALNGLTATIDDSEVTFAGQIAVSREGQVTTATKEAYQSCFRSLVSGKTPKFESGCIHIK